MSLIIQKNHDFSYHYSHFVIFKTDVAHEWKEYTWKKSHYPVTVAYLCNPSTQGAETRGFWVRCWPGLHCETLSPNEIPIKRLKLFIMNIRVKQRIIGCFFSNNMDFCVIVMIVLSVVMKRHCGQSNLEKSLLRAYSFKWWVLAHHGREHGSSQNIGVVA